MKFIVVLFVSMCSTSHAVTADGRTDLLKLRDRARTQLDTFDGGPDDSPERHRRALSELIDALGAVNDREWPDADVRELVAALTAPLTVAVDAPVSALLRRKQIENLFYFAALVDLKCRPAPWWETAGGELVTMTAWTVVDCAASVDAAAERETRTKMFSESAVLDRRLGAQAGQSQPDTHLFRAAVAAAATAPNRGLQLEALWLAIRSYFSLQDHVAGDCGEALASRVTPAAGPATPR